MSSPFKQRGKKSGIGHFPALDGLRGLALLGVLFFHANGALPGGYLGVDLFFVLSGFLITSLLLAEHESTAKIDLPAFWGRRARRLFPALLSLMPAIALYGRFVAAPGELGNLRADALATLGYVANWRSIFAHKSYWDLFAHPSPLEHTWSLSIEEQFYVIWPLVVWLALRRSKKTVLAITLGLLAVSMIAMLVLFDPENLSRVYLGTDARASGILAGATLACVLPRGATASVRVSRVLDASGLLCVAFLVIAWWNLHGEDPLLYHGGFWLTEAACLVLIVCAVTATNGLVARALSFRPLTLAGTVSYGAYLWHWPVDVFVTAERTHVHGRSLIAMQIAITFAIAIASYRFLERPIRQNGLPFGRPIYTVPSAVGLAVLLIVRGTFARAEPPPPPLPPMPVVIAPAPITFRVMMLGDSTANSLGWSLRTTQRSGLGVELMGRDGCTMLADTCYGSDWAEHVRTIRPNATIVFFGGAFLHGITVKGRWREACAAPWDTKFESTIERRLKDLKAPDHQVWVATLPYPLGPYDSEQYRRETDCINTSIRKAAATDESVKVLELGAHLCPTQECDYDFGGKTIRPDGVHFDVDGAHELSKWVLDEIAPEVDAGTLDLDGGEAREP